MATIKLYEDNAGMYHLTDGHTMWTAAFFPGDLGQARRALADWLGGEWEPTENDGWLPTPHDDEQAREVPAYLDMHGAADRIGVAYATVRRYRATGSFPAEDVRVGQSPGWLPATLDAWQASRPGRGSGGGRPTKGDA